jgi:hypothetical protein
MLTFVKAHDFMVARERMQGTQLKEDQRSRIDDDKQRRRRSRDEEAEADAEAGVEAEAEEAGVAEILV